MKTLPLFIILTVLTMLSTSCTQKGVHLFILSGQSNMAGLDPKISFTPMISDKFGSENIVVVKDAIGGQPIRRWYKDWTLRDGEDPKQIGDLYDQLMSKVLPAIEGKKVQTVTFLWMQGERDAREELADLYIESFNEIIKQLERDLGRNDINIVIGRLSDFDMENKTYPHWTRLRKLQVEFAESKSNAEWVNTDDLNTGVNKQGKPIENDLHYSVSGYQIFGERLAEKAIRQVER